MSRIYDAEKEAQLESDIQTLEADISETSARLQEFEGQSLDDSTMADRNEALARHQRLTNDHKIMSSKLADMRLFKPADKLPEAEPNPEVDALAAMLRHEGPLAQRIEISVDALMQHSRDRMVQRSDVSTNADGAGGGATQTLTQATLVDSLKAYGGGLNLIPIIETETGNEMHWPVTDNSTQEGEMLADEGTLSTTADPAAIGSKALGVKRFSSKQVQISNTMLQDAVFDVVTYATRLCARRIGRAISKKIVTGTNSADGIDGFKSIATAVASTSKVNFTVYDDAVKMIHSIDRAYLSSEGGLGSDLAAGSGLNNMGGFVGFAVSYDALRLLRVAKDQENRPLWQPNNVAGAPSMLQGYPVMVVDELDAFGTGATTGDVPILFGNFSYFQGRFAKTITIERFYDSGTAPGDFTTFLGMARFGMRSIIQERSSKNPGARRLDAALIRNRRGGPAPPRPASNGDGNVKGFRSQAADPLAGAGGAAGADPRPAVGRSRRVHDDVRVEHGAQHAGPGILAGRPGAGRGAGERRIRPPRHGARIQVRRGSRRQMAKARRQGPGPVQGQVQGQRRGCVQGGLT